MIMIALINCSPQIYIYGVSAGSSELGTFHSPFLEECTCGNGYSVKTRSGTDNLNCKNDGIGNCDYTTFGCSTNSTDTYENKIDSYGRLITDRTVTEQGGANGSLIVEGDCPPENYNFVGKRDYLWKNGVTQKLISTLTYAFPCDPDNFNNSPWYGSCGGGDLKSESCSFRRYSSNADPGCNESCGLSAQSLTAIENLNGLQTLEQRYSVYAVQISNKIFELVKNNSPHSDGIGGITQCGDGAKDDCWGIVESIFFSPDINGCNASNSQIALKVAVSSEDFSKKYASIKGKVILYSGGTGGKTPCCNDDFDGTIENEYSFNLDGSSNFTPNGLELSAQDLGSLNSANYNESVTFNICVSIEKIKFL